MKEVEELCDRILFIMHGRVVAQGTAAELGERFAATDLEQVFLAIARAPQEVD
jgi:ABC-type Na+ transport system ATPase subunit NatA